MRGFVTREVVGGLGWVGRDSAGFGSRSEVVPSRGSACEHAASMADATTAQCHLCKADVPAVAVDALEVAEAFPICDWSTEPNARQFRSVGYALLHHVCRSMQANARRDEPYFDARRGWWACREPDRPLDADAHFDVDCIDCVRRGAATHPPI